MQIFSEAYHIQDCYSLFFCQGREWCFTFSHTLFSKDIVKKSILGFWWKYLFRVPSDSPNIYCILGQQTSTNNFENQPYFYKKIRFTLLQITAAAGILFVLIPHKGALYKLYQ